MACISMSSPNLFFHSEATKMAIFVASEWKNKLGLDMEIQAMEFKVLLRKRKDGEFQVGRHGWNADYNDITTFLSQVQCDSDNNNNFNCNRQAEEILNQANNAKDPAQRKKLMTQATKMIMDEYPMVPLLQYTMGYSSMIIDRKSTRLN